MISDLINRLWSALSDCSDDKFQGVRRPLS